MTEIPTLVECPYHAAGLDPTGWPPRAPGVYCLVGVTAGRYCYRAPHAEGDHMACCAAWAEGLHAEQVLVVGPPAPPPPVPQPPPTRCGACGLIVLDCGPLRQMRPDIWRCRVCATRWEITEADAARQEPDPPVPPPQPVRVEAPAAPAGQPLIDILDDLQAALAEAPPLPTDGQPLTWADLALPVRDQREPPAPLIECQTPGCSETATTALPWCLAHRPFWPGVRAAPAAPLACACPGCPREVDPASAGDAPPGLAYCPPCASDNHGHDAPAHLAFLRIVLDTKGYVLEYYGLPDPVTGARPKSRVGLGTVFASADAARAAAQDPDGGLILGAAVVF